MNERYLRQLTLPNFSEKDQKTLTDSKVLIVGCGGLGNPSAVYLAGSGIGSILLIDSDTIELDNLQRQVIFNDEDIGKPKAKVLAEKLSKLNPVIEVNCLVEKLSLKNANELISKADIVLDCTDNFPTRYLINDACVMLNKPFVSGAIFRWEGHLATLNLDGSGNYRDLFPSPPPEALAPNCSQAGLIGPIAGIIGSMQALETIKVLINKAESSKNKLFLIDGETLAFRTINFRKSIFEKNNLEGEEYQIVNSISSEEVKQNSEKYLLIDIRTEAENKARPFGNIHIESKDLNEFLSDNKNEKTVVLCCQSGVRSEKFLRENSDFINVFSLKGGINEWDKTP